MSTDDETEPRLLGTTIRVEIEWPVEHREQVGKIGIRRVIGDEDIRLAATANPVELTLLAVFNEMIASYRRHRPGGTR